MCSSAGVTRPSWPEDKKTRYPGAADIPIVRLNPFNILNIKKDGKKLIDIHHKQLALDYSDT